ncbi:hypothetical protein WDU94_011297 [Cyamophila willieti]
MNILTIQGKALLKFIDAISEKTLRSTVSLTAARGRGKSAALGLAVAGAVAFGYSNIFVTSPSPENLNTFFQFIFKGFDALAYQEHLDYSIVQSTEPEYNKALVRVNVFRDHRQTIQYIHPTESQRLSQAELVVIDEAAAIPLNYVKSLMGPYLVYEGTGRSLSLKLLQQLRTSALPMGVNSAQGGGDAKSIASATGRSLNEITLDESIRYKPGDSVEKWLTHLLCLDATSVQSLGAGCPPPDSCDLYYISRDTLFCYHKASESFLQRIVSLFVASHYKNSPNDLQMMSDAPAHHLFCLLGPVNPNTKALPEVYCVVQVCLEGQVSRNSVVDGLHRGQRASGDLIPWTIAQQYQDEDFPALCGARVVRVATHPDYQGMGYGSRALSLLKLYYEGKIPTEDADPVEENIEAVEDEDVDLLEERIEPRKKLPPLLLKLSERPPEHLDYIGVSYGVTAPLLKFWKRAGFTPVYLRQTTNELTGEHTCIMLHPFTDSPWLTSYWTDFKRRFISLLGYQFRTFSPSLALSVVINKHVQEPQTGLLSRSELHAHVTSYDIKRLEMYCNNLTDYHLIVDLLPIITRLYFLNKFDDMHLSPLQCAILIGLGLQYKTVDTLTTELDIQAQQLLGLFNRTMRRILGVLSGVMEKSIEQSMMGGVRENEGDSMRPVKISMNDELETAAKELKIKQLQELKKLKSENLSGFVIKGSENEWDQALSNGKSKSIISIKIGEKRPVEVIKSAMEDHLEKSGSNKKKKSFKKHKK